MRHLHIREAGPSTMETAQKTGRLLAVTLLAGCAFIALFCAALFASGLMPDQAKSCPRRQDTALEEPAAGSLRHSDLIYEQVSALTGDSGQSSATLEELLPYLVSAESAQHPVRCCCIQLAQ